MKKLILLAAFAAGCASEPPKPGLVAGAHQPDSGSLLVRCGRLIDGLSDEARIGVEIAIANGRIEAVGENLEVPDATPVLDLSGFTVLPGLIDMHTHLADRPGSTADLSVYFEFPREQQLAEGRENAAATLEAGFTSVRDVGTYVAFIDKALRDEIDSGAIAGPRMQVAGYYLTIPGEGAIFSFPVSRRRTSPIAFARELRGARSSFGGKPRGRSTAAPTCSRSSLRGRFSPTEAFPGSRR